MKTKPIVDNCLLPACRQSQGVKTTSGAAEREAYRSNLRPCAYRAVITPNEDTCGWPQQAFVLPCYKCPLMNEASEKEDE